MCNVLRLPALGVGGLGTLDQGKPMNYLKTNDLCPSPSPAPNARGTGGFFYPVGVGGVLGRDPVMLELVSCW